MSTGTLTINGQLYELTTEQSLLADSARAELQASFDEIEGVSKDTLVLDNGVDPYLGPIERYERRLCEIVGIDYEEVTA